MIQRVKIFKMAKSCLAALALFAATVFIAPATTNADIMLGSFENDMSSPYAADWSLEGSVTDDNYVSYGATEGSSALEITKGTGWASYLLLNAGNALANDLVNHDFLAYDFSIPAGANGDGGVWAQAITVVQGDGMGFTTLDTTGIPTNGTVQTVIVDLSGVSLTTSSTWSQLILVAQGGEEGGDPDFELTIDNVRLFNAVPEPSSAGIIALMGSLLAFRRRRSS